jgi:acyl-CoA dehydrogenase
VQFGAPLSDKPLHVDTLAGLQAEFEAAFHLTFFTIELLGRAERGEADERQARLLRLMTPLMKLCTGKQAVAVLSEVLECFGGAGYVEDTGIPRLYRDAQVLPIWEGTTNVLSLDTLRAIAKDNSLRDLTGEMQRLCKGIDDDRLAGASRAGLAALEHAATWLESTYGRDPNAVEAGARRFAMTIARSAALCLLCRHAEWSRTVERDERAKYAALRFARHGVDLVHDESSEGDALLAVEGLDADSRAAAAVS